NNTNNITSLSFTSLTFNVGNPNDEDEYYPLRMKNVEYQTYMASVIQVMAPDVVVLQEVLSGKTCEAFTETDPALTCYEWDVADPPARRLLGPDYTIVCDGREQVECIGIHVTFGTIEGVGAGEYVEDGALTPSLPLPGCNWAAGGCTNDLCDDESTVSAVTVNTLAGPIRVVHMHPMAQVSATVAGDPCRALQIRQVFEDDVVSGEPALVTTGQAALILGDWNLGLEVYDLRTMFQPSDADDVWAQYIDCPQCLYTNLDPKNDSGERYSTTSNLSGLGQVIAIDHVVTTRNITGTCTVHDEGGMPGTDPLDAAYPGLSSLGSDERIDHYGISCNLTLTPAQ
ncbi:endonuclease/exonuclease/phosphatase family protein, partial [Myxococcota bacterium]|nr:endonuclease/exonuclease/phosphatase family protein [Myxococcota bacterium]